MRDTRSKSEPVQSPSLHAARGWLKTEIIWLHDPLIPAPIGVPAQVRLVIWTR